MFQSYILNTEQLVCSWYFFWQVSLQNWIQGSVCMCKTQCDILYSVYVWVTRICWICHKASQRWLLQRNSNILYTFRTTHTLCRRVILLCSVVLLKHEGRWHLVCLEGCRRVKLTALQAHLNPDLKTICYSTQTANFAELWGEFVMWTNVTGARLRPTKSFQPVT